MLDPATFNTQYRALHDACGFVDLTSRTTVELRGADRAAFLHNFCTNDIRNLAVGAGCEAFLLDARGHVLAYVLVHGLSVRLLVETAPGLGDRIFKHLNKYLIREQVTIDDASAEYAQLLVAGKAAAEVLAKLGLPAPQALYASAEIVHGALHESIVVRSARTIGDNWTLLVPETTRDDVMQRLVEAGAVTCEAEVADVARIEAGLPDGVDIGDKTLPQEVDRIERTINFRKGCYLGQETVARLDALGHVNRKLVGVWFSEATRDRIPSAATELTVAEAAVGRVTSSGWSPRFEKAVALAYLRTGANQPGTKLDSTFGPAEVVALPM